MGEISARIGTKTNVGNKSKHEPHFSPARKWRVFLWLKLITKKTRAALHHPDNAGRCSLASYIREAQRRDIRDAGSTFWGLLVGNAVVGGLVGGRIDKLVVVPTAGRVIG